MARYKEFWFSLVLLGLVTLECFLLSTVDTIGQFWVRFLHNYAQSRGITDEVIYRAHTRELYLTNGATLAVVLAGFGFELYWLIKRLRSGSQTKLASWVFGLALLPSVFLLSRGLLFWLSKQ